MNFKWLIGKFQGFLLSLFTILTVSFFLEATAAAAGPLAPGRGGGIDSGGGGAFLCSINFTAVVPPIEEPRSFQRNESHLLDLWEAEFLKKMKVPKTDEDVFVQLKRAFEKLRVFDSTLPEKLYELALELYTNKVPVDEGVQLEPPRDANSNYKMRGCDLVGMLFYDKELKRLVYDPEVFNVLKTKTDVAAAIAHEAWYYLVRQQWKLQTYMLGSQEISRNSVNTRKLIGCLFSSEKNCLKVEDERERIQKIYEEYKDHTYECRGKNAHLTLFPWKNGAVLSPNGFPLDTHMLLHRIGSRMFSVGVLGGAWLTQGYRFHPSPGALQEFDLFSLENLPNIFVSIERLPNQTPNKVLLLKPRSPEKMWYPERPDGRGNSWPVYNPDQVIDELTCEKKQ